MPTTSNFGWTTPADTDLVKDGAAAIRTLGNGIDTSLVDLKGGTTGQILSKASNTDLDYTWINNDQGDLTGLTAGVGISITSATGPVPTITNSSTDLITTAGDILYGTAADTVARLGIGTAGQVLTVNSGATAPQWSTPSTSLTWSLLNSGGTALSGSATTTISGISNKSDLFIVIDGATCQTGTSQFLLRINTDTGTNYNYFYMVNDAKTTYDKNIIYQGGSTTSDSASLAYPAGASDTIKGTIFIGNCNSTSYKTIRANCGGNFNAAAGYKNQWGQGVYVGTSTVSSISITSESYNFDGGTIYVYGA